MRNYLTTVTARCVLILSATVLLACSGCGTDSRATVSGTVKLDGAPLDNGTLEFRTPTGTGVLALAPITNGAFRVTADANLQPGKYKIVISSPKKSGKKIAAGSPAPPGTMVDEVVESIPSRYNSKSELEKTVVAGANTLDFNLTK